jgi:release factor glutamine methyltransferase
MNYQTVLSKATKILKGQLIKNPKLDCEILLSNALKIEREKLLINLNQEINEKDLNNFNNLIDRRKRKEPIAYIIGYKEFWKKKFKVNTNVLIPRPDTEHLVEEALKLIPNNSSLNILDIGTGTGCIILSILCERNKCYGVALDISKKALNVAKYNAKIQQIKNRIKFVNSDIDKFKLGTYDIILSNPPYIKNCKFNYLDEDIRFFEPKIALSGGIDGYSRIKNIINRSTVLIKKKRKVIFRNWQRPDEPNN